MIILKRLNVLVLCAFTTTGILATLSAKAEVDTKKVNLLHEDMRAIQNTENKDNLRVYVNRELSVEVANLNEEVALNGSGLARSRRGNITTWILPKTSSGKVLSYTANAGDGVDRVSISFDPECTTESCAFHFISSNEIGGRRYFLEKLPEYMHQGTSLSVELDRMFGMTQRDLHSNDRFSIRNMPIYHARGLIAPIVYNHSCFLKIKSSSLNEIRRVRSVIEGWGEQDSSVRSQQEQNPQDVSIDLDQDSEEDLNYAQPVEIPFENATPAEPQAPVAPVAP